MLQKMWAGMYLLAYFNHSSQSKKKKEKKKTIEKTLFVVKFTIISEHTRDKGHNKFYLNQMAKIFPLTIKICEGKKERGKRESALAFPVFFAVGCYCLKNKPVAAVVG